MKHVCALALMTVLSLLWLLKSLYLQLLILGDGLASPFGTGADQIQILYLDMGLLMGTAILLLFSRLVLGPLPSRLSLVLGTIAVLSLLQDGLALARAPSIQSCGKIICPEIAEAQAAPEIERLKVSPVGPDTGSPIMLFGGSGMRGGYLQDLKSRFEAAGTGTVTIAKPSDWSQGNMLIDGFSTLWLSSRDDQMPPIPVADNTRLIGYSYGGLMAAQLASDLADAEYKTAELVLIATPIDEEFLAQLRVTPEVERITVISLEPMGDHVGPAGSSMDRIGQGLSLLPDFVQGSWSDFQGHFTLVEPGPAGDRARQQIVDLLSGKSNE